MCVGCRALVFPATPFTVPQNRVAEGVASLALARPGTVQSVWFVVEVTGRSDPRLLGGHGGPSGLSWDGHLEGQTLTADVVPWGLVEEEPATASPCRCLWRKEEAQRPPRGPQFPPPSLLLTAEVS